MILTPHLVTISNPPTLYKRTLSKVYHFLLGYFHSTLLRGDVEEDTDPVRRHSSILFGTRMSTKSR